MHSRGSARSSPSVSPQKPLLPAVKEERKSSIESGEFVEADAGGGAASGSKPEARSFWSWGRSTTPRSSRESSPAKGGSSSPAMSTSPTPSSSFGEWFFGSGSPSKQRTGDGLARASSGLDLYEVERQVSFFLPSGNCMPMIQHRDEREIVMSERPWRTNRKKV